jgi:DNA-binding ferritin-like protein
MKESYSDGDPTTSMSRYEASFKVDSKTDSYAARRMLEQVYDTIREESRSVREGTDDADELLREFKTLRDAAKRSTPGKLTITYEQYDGGFED